MCEFDRGLKDGKRGHKVDPRREFNPDYLAGHSIGKGIQGKEKKNNKKQ